VLLINRLLKRRVIHPLNQLTTIARSITSDTITAEQVSEFNSPKVARLLVEPTNLDNWRERFST